MKVSSNQQLSLNFSLIDDFTYSARRLGLAMLVGQIYCPGTVPIEDNSQLLPINELFVVPNNSLSRLLAHQEMTRY